MNGWANPAAMWNERYSREELIYGDTPNTYFREQVGRRLTPGMKVLLPGDGYGRNGLWLARQGFSVHSVDLSSVGVERARKLAADAGVATMTIEQADLTKWEWPKAQYDAVATIFMHLPPQDREIVHAGMLRAAKSGGIVMLQAFSPEQLRFTSGGPKTVDLLYTADLLRKDFAGAEILELDEVVADLNEGLLHSGQGAVVQAVFRKK